jgi:SMC interacting uncharacterized protein involved in chromosome segregation
MLWWQALMVYVVAGGTLKTIADWFFFRDKVTAQTAERLWERIGKLEKTCQMLDVRIDSLTNENAILRHENNGLKVEVNDGLVREGKPLKYVVPSP